MFIKFVILLLLLIILVSLFSGLFSIRDDTARADNRLRSQRTVRTLTVRVAVSLLLFGLLILSYHLGWIG